MTTPDPRRPQSNRTARWLSRLVAGLLFMAGNVVGGTSPAHAYTDIVFGDAYYNCKQEMVFVDVDTPAGSFTPVSARIDAASYRDRTIGTPSWNSGHVFQSTSPTDDEFFLIYTPSFGKTRIGFPITYTGVDLGLANGTYTVAFIVAVIATTRTITVNCPRTTVSDATAFNVTETGFTLDLSVADQQGFILDNAVSFEEGDQENCVATFLPASASYNTALTFTCTTPPTVRTLPYYMSYGGFARGTVLAQFFVTIPNPSVRSPGAMIPLAPWRILDTRTTGGTLHAAESRWVQVTGQGRVPVSGVSAVVLNVTVTETTSGGYLTVSPTGTARPTASNLNWAAGATIPNAVTVKVGDGGKIDLFQPGPGTAQVIVDVAGYYVDGVVAAAGGFTSIAPARILDTRSIGGKLAASESRDLQITGAGGVPASTVSAVVLNVTVTDTTSGGYLTVYPAGTTKPLASNLNWAAGTTIPNLVTVKVGDTGKVALYQSGPGTAHVIVDVAGYYLGGTPTQPGMFVALAPARVLDTRNTGKITGGADVTLPILDAGGIPATGVSAVVVNTTVTDTTAAGYLTVYPGTNALPTASNLNWVTGTTIPNLVTVQTGTDGTIKFHNGSSGTTQIIADTAGYYLS